MHTARGVIVLNSITYREVKGPTSQPCFTSGCIASHRNSVRQYSHLLFRILLCDFYRSLLQNRRGPGRAFCPYRIVVVALMDDYYFTNRGRWLAVACLLDG